MRVMTQARRSREEVREEVGVEEGEEGGEEGVEGVDSDESL